MRALDAAGNILTDWIPVSGAMIYPNGQQSTTFDLATVGGPLIGQSFEVEVVFTTSDRAIRPIIYDIQVGWDRP